jgi:hypothetical protein
MPKAISQSILLRMNCARLGSGSMSSLLPYEVAEELHRARMV